MPVEVTHGRSSPRPALHRLSTENRKPMTPVQRAAAIGVLRGVLDLLTPRKNWTQQVYARDKHRMSIDSQDERAVCWCLQGALRKIAWTSYENEVHATQLLLTHVKHVGEFNDSHTHEEVIALLTKVVQ